MYPPPSTDYPQKPPPPPPSSSPPPTAPPPPYNYHQQPPQYATGIPVASHPPVNTNWTSSLCACCSDVPNCCLTCWCPCITFGQIAEIVDKGNTSCAVHASLYAIIAAFTCCGCIYSCMFRSKMRVQYGLRETPCNDCVVHCCCELCALCQEYRELQHRGFDLSIGWQGNVERQNHGVQMPPIAPGGMYR